MKDLEGKGRIDYNYAEDILYFYLDKTKLKDELIYDY